MKKTHPQAELVILPDVIRVETALSRFPVHRLIKQGTVPIEIRETTADGELVLHWEIAPNARLGQPGPLAYKLDTLVINRKIEAAGRPIPRYIRLGSLKEIAHELDLGGDTTLVKRALLQNAGAFITAKIRYKSADGAERRIEVGDTRICGETGRIRLGVLAGPTWGGRDTSLGGSRHRWITQVSHSK